MSDAHGSWLQLAHRPISLCPQKRPALPLAVLQDGGAIKALRCSPWGMFHRPIHIVRLLLTSSDSKQGTTYCVSLPKQSFLPRKGESSISLSHFIGQAAFWPWSRSPAMSGVLSAGWTRLPWFYFFSSIRERSTRFEVQRKWKQSTVKLQKNSL